MKNRWIFLLMVLVMAGCDSLLPPEPTSTPRIDDSATLAPSPTVLPVVSEEDENAFVGRSNPTAAGLAAEGEPAEESTPEMLPTQAVIPILIFSADGTRLHSDYLGAPLQPAPVVLLVHGEEASRAEQDVLARDLQVVGYNVMHLSLRGYGHSAGSVDWSRAAEDVRAALNTLRTLPGVSGIAVVGLGAGGAAAYIACAQDGGCSVLVMVNPLEHLALSSLDQITSNLPVYLLVGEDAPDSLLLAQRLNNSSPGRFVIQLYPNVSLFDSLISSQIAAWLRTHLPIPAVTP